MEKAQLETDPGAQHPSRSLCGWRIPERGVSSHQAQEENARAPIGLLEAVSREDGPGWLRTETAQHSSVLGGGAGEEPGWWAGNGGVHAASWAGERQGGSGFPAGGNAQAQPVAKPSSAEEDGWKMGEKSLKMAPWPSQGWKSLLGVQLWKHSLLEAYSSPRSNCKTWHSFRNCPLGSLSLRAGCFGSAGSFACEVMCNRRMVWELPQGNLLSLGLSFMRFGHEANKEKENSTD